MHLNWWFVFLQNMIEEGSGFYFFLESMSVLEMEEEGFNGNFLLLHHLGQDMLSAKRGP